MRMKLTQKTADALKFAGKREFFWDEKTPGFGIEIAARSRTFVVKYRVGQSSKRVQLGNADSHTVEYARARAMELIAGAKQGRDLLHKSEGEKTSFKTMCDRWIKHSRPDGRSRSPRTIKDYKDRCERLIYPTLGSKLLPDVSTTDVQRLLAGLGSQERNRSYVLTIVRAVFNFAISEKELPKTFDSPADGIKLTKVKTDKRVLSGEEIERFGATLAAMVECGEVSPHLAGLLRLSLLCGLRPGEAQTLKWSGINFDRAQMLVSGKTGERTVPLTEPAIEALRAVPRIEGVKWVFAGRIYGQHLTGISKQLDRIATRAGIERFSPYTFRHTAATQALISGADARAVQALLGHGDLRTTTGYLHSDSKRERQAAEGVAAVADSLRPRKSEAQGRAHKSAIDSESKR